MSLTQYNYGSGNYAEFVSRCEKTGIGMIALSLTNYDNNNSCEIAEGSVVEINGAIFRQATGNTAITGTPANNAVNYILMSAANNAATAAWNNSAPSWNTAYQGYYVGNNRYVGGCYYDGANYTEKFIYYIRNARVYNRNSSDTDRRAFRAYSSNNQSIPGMSSPQIMNLDVESYDLGSCYNNTTYKFIVPFTGYYHIVAQATLIDMAINTAMGVYITANNSEILRRDITVAFAVTYSTSGISSIEYLTAGHEVYAGVINADASSRSLYASSKYTYFAIARYAFA
jgi:hypothetical protein